MNDRRTGSPDSDALLVALTLAPATFSRNKFFRLYADESLFHARRRAQLLRGIVRELTLHLKAGSRCGQAEELDQTQTADGVRITYRIPGFEYRRTALLTELEAALFRYCMARARGDEPTRQDDEQIKLALLSLELPPPAAAGVLSTPELLEDEPS